MGYLSIGVEVLKLITLEASVTCLVVPEYVSSPVLPDWSVPEAPPSPSPTEPFFVPAFLSLLPVFACLSEHPKKKSMHKNKPHTGQSSSLKPVKLETYS